MKKTDFGKLFIFFSPHHHDGLVKVGSPLNPIVRNKQPSFLKWTQF